MARRYEAKVNVAAPATAEIAVARLAAARKPPTRRKSPNADIPTQRSNSQAANSLASVAKALEYRGHKAPGASYVWQRWCQRSRQSQPLDEHLALRRSDTAAAPDAGQNTATSRGRRAWQARVSLSKIRNGNRACSAQNNAHPRRADGEIEGKDRLPWSARSVLKAPRTRSRIPSDYRQTNYLRLSGDSAAGTRCFL